MLATANQFIFFGIDNISKDLDSIIKSLDVKNKSFEIKLILSEAITNAFIHGNNKDKSKPIVVIWKKEKDYLNIRIEDCGKNKENLRLNKYIDENSILEESGRGLFIISAYADEVKFEDNCIVMKKSLIWMGFSW